MMKEPSLINILIIEADPIFALGLTASLQQAGYSIAGIAGHAEEAGRLFIENEVDIILAGLQLPGDKDGIDTIIELMKIKRTPVIYLITAEDSDVINRTRQTFPAAILIKPCNSTNICMAVELAIQNGTHGEWREYASDLIPIDPNAAKEAKDDIIDKETIFRQGNHIFIKRNFKFIKIGLHEILYMEADGNYIHIIITDKKFTLRLSLTQAIRKINCNKLVRINRSSVVNVDAIQSFNKEHVVIAQYEIPIGKNYKESFFMQLGFR